MGKKFAISRIANYKFSDVGGVLKEALRTLPNYDNPECDPSKSYLNVSLVDCDLKGFTPEKYILNYRKENNIKGRFNTRARNSKNLTNCMSQALFTASKEYLDGFDRDGQIKYFEDCLSFFRSEFSNVPILSAIIHFDETTPHMHVTFLPIVERINSKTGELESIFSTTKLMPGKDFFAKYQDRFYNYISAKYDGLERGNSDRKNLDVKSYKIVSQALQEAQNKSREIEALRKEINAFYDQIGFLYYLQNLERSDNPFLDIPFLREFILMYQELRMVFEVDELHDVIDDLHNEVFALCEARRCDFQRLHTPLDSTIKNIELQRSRSSERNKTEYFLERE